MHLFVLAKKIKDSTCPKRKKGKVVFNFNIYKASTVIYMFILVLYALVLETVQQKMTFTQALVANQAVYKYICKQWRKK